MRRPLSGRRATRAVLAAGAGLALIIAGGPALATPDGGKVTERAVISKVDKDLLSALADDEQTSFWVNLDSKADTSAARLAATKAERGAIVYQTKVDHAERTQRELRQMLTASGARFKSFWIINTVHVTGDKELVERIASLDNVASITPDDAIQLPAPLPGQDEARINGVEWGLANINAPQAWSDFGALGDGIVVSSIDSGVQYDHPALVNQYRGNNGDGTFSHDYNWFDPAAVCAGGLPCDNNNHGSHTMGTMVGDDGADNQIGVAPQAKWIAAKGCETSSCTRPSLLAAGQWIVAPTDRAGNNPDPSKAPHIVNNSWGASVDDPWYEEIVQAWIDAGIFPSFSNGNSGSSCSTSGSPGIYEISYSSGAYDVNNTIASFSSRGPGRNGQVKPNLAAPGVNVRSSIRNGAYGSLSGTSMAAPHTSGVVALMWSAAPALQGDIAATRALLDSTARDTANAQCGGTDANNNVFGEGRLDAHAAVDASPRGDVGAMSGTVTANGAGVGGVTIAVDGPIKRTATTAPDGSFAFPILSAGDYTLTAAKFGYDGATVAVTVTAGQTIEVPVVINQVPSGVVSGVVKDAAGQGWPLYAKVTVDGTGVWTHTDPVTGEYALTLPLGAYTFTVEAVYPGYETVQVPATTGALANVDLGVTADCTAAGYEFDYSPLPLRETFDAPTTPAGWQIVDRGNNQQPWRFDNPRNRLNLTGGSGRFAMADSDAGGSGGKLTDTDLITPPVDLTSVDDPTLYFASDYRHLGNSRARVRISVDGGATWDQLWELAANARGPRVEQIDLSAYASSADALIMFQYYDGTSFAWWWQVDDVQIGTADCVPVDGGLLVGTVSDGNTGAPIDGAVVTDSGSDASATSATVAGDPNGGGFYWMFTDVTGAREVAAGKTGWVKDSETVDVVAGAVVRTDFQLGAGRITTSRSSLETSVVLGGTVSGSFNVTNTGTVPVAVDIAEQDDGFEVLTNVSWLSIGQAQFSVAPGETVAVRVTTSSRSSDGVAQPGTYRATLNLQTDTPYGTSPVRVAMNVAPKRDMGKVSGTIYGESCAGVVAPLGNVQIQFQDPRGNQTHLKSGATGRYQYWFSRGNYKVIVSRDGWAAQAGQVQIQPGNEVVANFTLTPIGCTDVAVSGGRLMAR